MNRVKYHTLLIVEAIIRNIGGGAGIRIRAAYYRHRCESFGSNVRIDVGVHLENPESICFGNNVWVMPYTVITARPRTENFNNRTVYEKRIGVIGSGRVVIGDGVSIGLYNIIQGYGEIVIHDNVTTSARVSIYSFSHVPFDQNNRKRRTFANAMNNNKDTICLISPIVIGKGAWLGLNVAVFGANIGEWTFVKSGSIVVNDLAANLMIGCYPSDSKASRYEEL